MVAGQCSKSVEALCICVSVTFCIALESDVFRISCWTLQFTKYFNITNGKNRRWRKKKAWKGKVEEREIKNKVTAGDDMRADGRVCERNHRTHNAQEHKCFSINIQKHLWCRNSAL